MDGNNGFFAIQWNIDISKLMGLFFTSSNYRSTN